LSEAKCRVCGCTETTPCIDKDGDACWWIEDDLCSACVYKSLKRAKEKIRQTINKIEQEKK
jgi:hypothetical protein